MNLAEKIQALYAKYGSLKGVTIELHKQLIAISVKNEAASATIFLQGAQVAEYKRVGERPLLWLSEACDFKAGKSLRGGIPICWPWFGDITRNPAGLTQQLDEKVLAQLPAHGLVREQDWALDSVERVDSETTQVVLSLAVSSSEQWPFPALLQLTVTVGVELDVKLTVENTGSEAFNFTTAFHSYLNLSAVSACEVVGLEGCNYFDTLDDWQVRKSNLPITIDREIDRVYTNVGSPTVLNDSKFNRSISVMPLNAPDLVVWNPWIDKAKRLSHFNDDAYTQMVCLETASVLDNVIELTPGMRVDLGVKLSIA